MQNNSSKDPLHGITLQKIVEDLVLFYGFDTLSELIKIKCFTSNPSVKSSLNVSQKNGLGAKEGRGVVCEDFAEAW